MYTMHNATAPVNCTLDARDLMAGMLEDLDADAGDVESDPSAWPAWTDERWTTGPDPDDAPSLDLAELVDRQADAYRAWPLEAGAMIAEVLDALALRIRMTGAATPAEYSARVEVLDADVRSAWESAGYEAGKASCPCHDHAGTAFGHMA